MTSIRKIKRQRAVSARPRIRRSVRLDRLGGRILAHFSTPPTFEQVTPMPDIDPATGEPWALPYHVRWVTLDELRAMYPHPSRGEG